MKIPMHPVYKGVWRKTMQRRQIRRQRQRLLDKEKIAMAELERQRSRIKYQPASMTAAR